MFLVNEKKAHVKERQVLTQSRMKAPLSHSYSRGLGGMFRDPICGHAKVETSDFSTHYPVAATFDLTGGAARDAPAGEESEFAFASNGDHPRVFEAKVTQTLSCPVVSDPCAVGGHRGAAGGSSCVSFGASFVALESADAQASEPGEDLDFASKLSFRTMFMRRATSYELRVSKARTAGGSRVVH